MPLDVRLGLVLVLTGLASGYGIRACQESEERLELRVLRSENDLCRLQQKVYERGDALLAACEESLNRTEYEKAALVEAYKFQKDVASEAKKQRPRAKPKAHRP